MTGRHTEINVTESSVVEYSPKKPGLKAKEYCHAYDGIIIGNRIGRTTLASAPSSAINNFLKRLKPYWEPNWDPQPVWLGGERTNGRWSWIDGSPWGYQNWGNQGNENGLVLNPNGLWNDDNKRDFHHFVCQYQYI